MQPSTARYARCIKASKRVRWEIDADVIRGRDFDFTQTFLPAGLSLVDELPFLTAVERRLMSQVQGRTYAYLFGLVERFIGAKVLELSGRHWLGDQTALEALVRFSDEELKHQELFRRIEDMMDAHMPAGYACVAEPNEVAAVVLRKSTWSVLALTCLIELFTQMHYQQSIEPQARPLAALEGRLPVPLDGGSRSTRCSTSSSGSREDRRLSMQPEGTRPSTT